MADDGDRNAPFGEGRLARWSRLKQKTRSRGAASPVVESAEREQVAAIHPKPDGGESQQATFLEDPLGGPGRYLTAEEEAITRELPPIESLTPESDFSAFMNPKVPDILQRAALKKLWQSNPFFNLRDGLNEYDDDYTLEPLINAVTDTKYKAERGMFDENDPEDPRYQARLEEERTKAAAAKADDAEEDGLGDGESEETVAASDDPESAEVESPKGPEQSQAQSETDADSASADDGPDKSIVSQRKFS